MRCASEGNQGQQALASVMGGGMTKLGIYLSNSLGLPCCTAWSLCSCRGTYWAGFWVHSILGCLGMCIAHLGGPHHGIHHSGVGES